MVMLDTEMLIQVKNERNFKTQSHRLYNELSYSSLKDAEQDLLHYFCHSKLKKMTLNQFKKIWNNTNEYDGEHKNRKYILYQLTYSRQDLLRKHQKEKDQKHECLESLKFNYVPTYTVDEQEPKKEEKSPLEKQKELVLANLFLLFPRAKTQKAYIEATLNGKDFKFAKTVNENIMLKQISDYSNKHRADFNKVLNRELSNKDRKLLSFIDTFLSVENNGKTLFEIQGKQAELIEQHKKLFEDLIGTCGEGKSCFITHQVALLNSWEKIEYQEEKGYMITYLRMKKEELENKLN